MLKVQRLSPIGPEAIYSSTPFGKFDFSVFSYYSLFYFVLTGTECMIGVAGIVG